MNMQQLMIQAQKMQKEMSKAKDALATQEFTASANGGVTIKMNGKKEVLDLDIDKDLLDPANVDMLKDMIKVALNNVLGQIEEADEKIQEKAAGGMRF